MNNQYQVTATIVLYKNNIEELKSVVYKRVKELHVQKYPYNDFLYQTYEEEEE